MRLNIGAEIIEYQINYSRRKTMAITIKGDGTIRVSAPKGTASGTVQEWVNSKSGWIEAKLAQVQMVNQQMPQRSYRAGETFNYLGQPRTLQLQTDNRLTRSVVRMGDNTLVIRGADCSPAAVKEALEARYRSAARLYIHQRVQHYQSRLGKIPGRITIRDQKTRWGSCSAKGNLNFNWRIMMAPPEIIDYLVVHELCHLVHLDHSPSFWNLVASILPDYKLHRAWLRKNGPGLRM